MFLNLPEIYIEVFLLVGVLSGLGVGLVLQPLEICGCTLLCGTFKNRRPSDTPKIAQVKSHVRGEAEQDQGVEA